MSCIPKYQIRQKNCNRSKSPVNRNRICLHMNHFFLCAVSFDSWFVNGYRRILFKNNWLKRATISHKEEKKTSHLHEWNDNVQRKQSHQFLLNEHDNSFCNSWFRSQSVNEVTFARKARKSAHLTKIKNSSNWIRKKRN